MYHKVTLQLLWRTPTVEQAEDEAQPLLNDIAGSYGYTIVGFGAETADADLVAEFIEDSVKAEQAHQKVTVDFLVRAAGAAEAEDEAQPLLNDIAGSYGYTIVGFGAETADADLVAEFIEEDEDDE